MTKYKLGDIADFNKRALNKSDSIKEIIYLDTSSITENVISDTVTLHVADAPSRAQRKVEHYTIIYSTVRPRLKHYGILKTPSSNLIVSTGFVTIDLKPEYKGYIDPRYLYLLLTQPSITEYIGNIADTAVSAYPSINPSDISALSFNFPEFRIQNRIADVWENYDQKIALNRAINDNLEAMAKQLYDYWFVQFDFPNEEGKPYKSSGGKMVWNDKLKREIPENWGDCKLRYFINLFDSMRIPLSSKDRERRKGNYPYYGATGIMDYVNDYIFDGDYILLAEDGSTSDANGFPIVQYIWGKNWVNNHAHIILPKKELHKMFTYQMLKNIPAKKIETGSIQKKISQENLCGYNMLFPEIHLLEQYEAIIIPLWERRKKNIEEIEALIKQRDELLPLLMNGQVSVNYHLSHD
jgi:type I restriction enzyme S subunit